MQHDTTALAWIVCLSSPPVTSIVKQTIYARFISCLTTWGHCQRHLLAPRHILFAKICWHYTFKRQKTCAMIRLAIEILLFSWLVSTYQRVSIRLGTSLSKWASTAAKYHSLPFRTMVETLNLSILKIEVRCNGGIVTMLETIWDLTRRQRSQASFSWRNGRMQSKHGTNSGKRKT
jgi:hypothetical protein